MKERHRTAVLATFAHEIMLGIYERPDLAARDVLQALGLTSMDQVVSLTEFKNKQAASLKQASEVKFLKAQGWTLQAIQAAYPKAQYSTLHRTFAGMNNKAVATVAPEWFLNGKEE